MNVVTKSNWKLLIITITKQLFQDSLMSQLMGSRWYSIVRSVIVQKHNIQILATNLPIESCATKFSGIETKKKVLARKQQYLVTLVYPYADIIAVVSKFKKLISLLKELFLNWNLASFKTFKAFIVSMSSRFRAS